MGCAEKIDRACELTFIARQFRETEIADVAAAILIEKNIRRFQIAMKHATLVSELHRFRKCGHKLGYLAPLPGEPGLALSQSAPGGQLHGEERHPVVFAYLVNGQDCWMLQGRERSHFQSEALGHFC